ncbi:transcriptional regulator FeaR [Rhodococcus sp. IEGM1300]
MIDSSAIRNEAFENWLSQVNQACGRFDARALDTDFYGELAEHRNGAINLSVVDMAHVHLYRTSKDVSVSSDGHYYAVFQMRGSSQLEQGDNRARLDCGDIALIDACRPSDMTYNEDSRQLSLIVPRQVLERGSHFSGVNCATRIAGNTPLAALANQLVLDTRQRDWLDMNESEAVLDALASLLLPGISSRHSGADSHERQFRKIIAYIDAHISAQALCPELIASEVGISVRGLYRMFSKRGLVVAQYIKHRRLDFCAENLRRAPGEQKLSALCYAWGFSDSSYFSSAFKARFGVSPGVYRKRYSV